MTLSEITNNLNSIARDLNLEGPSITALIRLLAKAIYDNELCTTNLILESSISRSRNLNSRITAAADLGYSVFRGRNQRVSFKDLEYIYTESKIVNKLDELTKFGKYSLLYASDYEFSPRTSNVNSIYDIDVIVADSVNTISRTIDENNKLAVYFPVNNISGDLIIKVNGELVSYQEGLYYGSDNNGSYLTDDNSLCVITISGFGVMVINRNRDSIHAFKEGDVVELKYVRYLPDSIDISSIKSIDGFNYSNRVSYTVTDYVPRNESNDLIYFNALTNFRNSYTIKSDDDIKSIIETYFSNYITGCNIKKYYVTDRYTTLLVGPKNTVSTKFDIVPGEIDNSTYTLISNLTNVEIPNIDNKYILFSGEFNNSSSRVIGGVELTVTQDGVDNPLIISAVDIRNLSSELSKINAEYSSYESLPASGDSNLTYFTSSTGSYYKYTSGSWEQVSNPIENYQNPNSSYYDSSKSLDEFKVYKFDSLENGYIPKYLEVNRLQLDINVGGFIWIFNMSFLDSNLEVTLNELNSVNNPIDLDKDTIINLKYSYLDLSLINEDQSIIPSIGYVLASSLKYSNPDKVTKLVVNSDGDPIYPESDGSHIGTYKLVTNIPSQSDSSNFTISYIYNGTSYIYSKDDNTNLYTCSIDGNLYSIELSNDSEFSELYSAYLKVDSGDLLDGELIINYVSVDKVVARYSYIEDEIEYPITSSIKYYNCDEGKWIDSSITDESTEDGKINKKLGVSGSVGTIVVPMGDREKLWIIQFSQDPISESTGFSGICYKNNDPQEYNYGPGNLLHIDTYYSNSEDKDIPEDDELNFMSMIKLVYYVENVTFNFKRATMLSKFPTKSGGVIVSESGYPLDIKVNYSYGSSLSSIRSRIESLFSEFKFKIGVKFNLYELLANIQSITGVKYITINDSDVSTEVDVPDDNYILIDPSNITYNPINDITKNIRNNFK